MSNVLGNYAMRYGRDAQKRFNRAVYKLADKIDRQKNPTVRCFQPYNISEFKALLKASLKFFKTTYGKSAESFLDVGCGVGDKLLLARERGLTSDGIELSEILAATSRLTSPHSFVFEQDLFKFKNYNAYDIIFVFNPTVDGGAKVIRAITKQIKTPCVILYTCTNLPAFDEPMWLKWQRSDYLVNNSSYCSRTIYYTGG